MKIRAVPRGYVPLDHDAMNEKIMKMTEGSKTSDFFMGLYNIFGNPQQGGVYSYMLRHNNVVVKITAKDMSTMDYSVWVSPGHVQDARRRQTKAMNVIARRLNSEGVAFIPNGDMPSGLYYSVRLKNNTLMSIQKRMSVKEITDRMNDMLTPEEHHALYGGIIQYMPEVETEIKNILENILNGNGVLHGEGVPREESVQEVHASQRQGNA